MLSTNVNGIYFCNVKISKQSISHVAQTFSQQKFGGVNFSSYLCSAKTKERYSLFAQSLTLTQPLIFHIQCLGLLFINSYTHHH